jgi:hypothetical protein
VAMIEAQQPRSIGPSGAQGLKRAALAGPLLRAVCMHPGALAHLHPLIAGVAFPACAHIQGRCLVPPGRRVAAAAAATR